MTSNKQIAHLWFNQSKQHATGSNMFFEGNNIFSYGRHFLMASIVTNKKGNQAVLVTTRGYSVSTSRHQSYVERAMDERFPIFRVKLDMQGIDSRWQEYHAKNIFNEYKTRVKDAGIEVKNCHNKNASGRLTWYCRLIKEANNFAAFAGIRARLKINPKIEDIAANKTARHEETEAKKNTPEAIARRAKDKAKREAAKERKQAEMVKKWIDGESDRMNWQRGDLVYMRVKYRFGRIEGQQDMIETSQGAEFPVEHGKKAFSIIMRCRETKTEWHTNGHKIPLGHFQIDMIDQDGNVKAGCHRVNYSEIERIAKLVGIA